MKLLLLKSIRDFKTNILLNISIFLLAFVGIFLFGGLNVTGISLKSSIDEFYLSHNLASYTVTQELPFEKMKLLYERSKEDGLVLDGAKQLDAVTLNVGGIGRNIEVSLFTRNDFVVNTPQIVEGQLPEETFEALIDLAFAKENGVKVGDTLPINIEGQSYETVISGLAVFPDHLYKGDAIPQIAETGIVKIFVDLDIGANTFYVKTDLGEVDLRLKLEMLSDMPFSMSRVIGKSDNVSVKRVASDIDLITSLISILPWVCLISLCLILYVNASKRAEDEGYNIGIMCANGVSKSKIVFSLMLPYLVNVFIGGLLGAILGIIVLPDVYINLLSRFYTLPSVTLGGLMVAFIALVVLMVVTTVALLIAVSSLFMRTPTSLMRSAHKSGSKIIKSTKAPIVLKLSLRNFISYKKKSIFSTVSAALCLGLLVTSFMLDDSVSDLNRTVYGKYYNYDYTISWNAGDKLDYTELSERAMQSGLFENQMFCLEFPAKYDGKNVLVSIMDENNPCYKIDGFNADGVCIPKSYGDVESIDINLYSQIPLEMTLPVSGSYKDIGMFGIIVPLALINQMYPDFYYLYMQSGLNTKLYLKQKPGVDAEAFTDELRADYSVAFNGTLHSVGSKRFQELFTVISVTELVLIVICGIMMAVMVLNISSLSLSDRIRDYSIFKALGIGGDKVNALSSLENVFSVLIAYLLAFPIGALISQKIIKAVAVVTGVVAYLHITVISALILFVCAAIFTVIGNILINNKIKRVNVVSALKKEE